MFIIIVFDGVLTALLLFLRRISTVLSQGISHGMWLLAWEFLLIKSVLHFAFLHLLSFYNNSKYYNNNPTSFDPNQLSDYGVRDGRSNWLAVIYTTTLCRCSIPLAPIAQCSNNKTLAGLHEYMSRIYMHKFSDRVLYCRNDNDLSYSRLVQLSCTFFIYEIQLCFDFILLLTYLT